MKVFDSIQSLRKYRTNLNGTIGFTPTMGALHDGHLSLIKSSKKHCDYSIVSIFINPTQFAINEDLTQYPQTKEKDLELLKSLNVDAVFFPSKNTMYPKNYSTFVNEKILSAHLEGNSRPQFLKGVTTIVSKLFNIIQPTHSFFGKKDAQQLRVIKKMVSDLNIPIKIISCPTVREKNGLAMSSRNQYLNKKSRNRASIIFKAISIGKNLIIKGNNNSSDIKKQIKDIILSDKLAVIDYVSIACYYSLKEFNITINDRFLISCAINFDGVRLIDNIDGQLPLK